MINCNYLNVIGNSIREIFNNFIIAKIINPRNECNSLTNFNLPTFHSKNQNPNETRREATPKAHRNQIAIISQLTDSRNNPSTNIRSSEKFLSFYKEIIFRFILFYLFCSIKVKITTFDRLAFMFV